MNKYFRPCNNLRQQAGFEFETSLSGQNVLVTALVELVYNSLPDGDLEFTGLSFVEAPVVLLDDSDSTEYHVYDETTLEGLAKEALAFIRAEVLPSLYFIGNVY
jgi:hypothetical protein